MHPTLGCDPAAARARAPPRNSVSVCAAWPSHARPHARARSPDRRGAERERGRERERELLGRSRCLAGWSPGRAAVAFWVVASWAD